MKTMFFALVLFGCAASSCAQCDSTVSSGDTIGSVKKKLACFADENAKLKQQLANPQTVSGQLRIATSSSFGFLNSQFSVEAFIAKAIGTVVKRGGSVEAQGADWVDLKLGEKAVSTICDAARLEGFEDLRIGLVIVAGYGSQENLDLSKILKSEIAPPN